ncbi:MAG: hypothetical protein IT537_08580 [Hyphomicrobiales bacterium]|nr:hypothetical protein [Hyphomicrobiales bacterium]
MMARTYFHDFVRDDGRPVTVEYSASGGESDFDHPGHICDGGGSGPEICIVDCWPNEPWFDDLARRLNARSWPGHAPTLLDRLCAAVLRLRHSFHRRRCRLTDAERERMEAHIAENYVEEPYEEDF